MGMRRRRSPGLVNTVARTAVVAGTATVVAGGVAGKQQQKAQAHAQEAAAQQAEQQQIADMQAQLSTMQAQQAAAAIPVPAAGTGPASPDMMTQLMQLAELKGAGLLSDEEFASAKAKLLET
jgi:hypothetical protein